MSGQDNDDRCPGCGVFEGEFCLDDCDWCWAGGRPDEPADGQPSRNLLAVIHGDGGHHTEKVGLTQSLADAIDVVARLRAEVGRLTHADEQTKPDPKPEDELELTMTMAAVPGGVAISVHPVPDETPTTLIVPDRNSPATSRIATEASREADPS